LDFNNWENNMKAESSRRYYYRGITIDDRTYKYIEKKIIAIEKLLGRVVQVEIEIEMDKKRKFQVEVMVKTPYNLYRARKTTGSIEGSIDLIYEQLKKQITSIRGKLKTLIKKGRRKLKERMVTDKKAL